MTQSPTADPLSSRKPVSLMLELVGDGDRGAFSLLYDAYSARVFGLVLRVVGDRSQAEEVTQEVFLEVWRSADLYDPAREGAVGWMLAIAHRKAVDRVRSSGGPRPCPPSGRESVLGFDATAAGAGASPQAGRVRTSLDVLSPVQRRALELAYFGGHTHAEVAQILHIPLPSAKTRIRNALIHLRESLGPAHA